MNAFRQMGREARKQASDAATFPSEEPTIEIDSIITGPPGAWMPATASVVPERLASDHRPVVADLRLTGE